MFDSADAVRAWQQGSGAQLIGDQSMLAGSYVLVQLGQRKTGGCGLLIGPEAQVDNQRVRLHGTFFEPDVDGAATEMLNSPCVLLRLPAGRSEEHTSELQSLMRISYAVFRLKNK